MVHAPSVHFENTFCCPLNPAHSCYTCRVFGNRNPMCPSVDRFIVWLIVNSTARNTNPWNFNWITNICFLKGCIWKCILQNNYYFVQGEMGLASWNISVHVTCILVPIMCTHVFCALSISATPNNVRWLFKTLCLIKHVRGRQTVQKHKSGWKYLYCDSNLLFW